MHCDLSSIQLGISLFCFSFPPFFLSGNSFSLTYYAQGFAPSFNILSYIASCLCNSDIICIIYLNCIYTSWTAITILIMSLLYSCVGLINVKTKCANCSIRVHQFNKHLGGATLLFTILNCCIPF